LDTFSDFKLSPTLHDAIERMGFKHPTAIQSASFSKICSGRDLIGIAQTGTGKTMAYTLPLVRNLTQPSQNLPRILILVPTRELVAQVVDSIKNLCVDLPFEIVGIFGGTNINTQKKQIENGADIVVATPGRLYDLAVSRALRLKAIQRLIIDEVDVMLDLGFRHQLINIFDLLPEQRQNVMFSATMNSDVENIISNFFKNPYKVSTALSGTPLRNINQIRFDVPNYNSKLNLLLYLLAKKETFSKVLIFVDQKRIADRLFETLEFNFINECGVLHSNKSQNYRRNAIDEFKTGTYRVLVTTDLMARGIDIDAISHVVSFNTPEFCENYMHRIGRTGRAQKQGESILLSTKKEHEFRVEIERYMDFEIKVCDWPSEVEISNELMPEEQNVVKERYNPHKNKHEDVPGPAFHEKKEKNKKVNLGGSYRKTIAKKYKKPKTRGDKNFNRKKRK
jgi:ATP-dependent RNA helicase RhlE